METGEVEHDELPASMIQDSNQWFSKIYEISSDISNQHMVFDNGKPFLG